MYERIVLTPSEPYSYTFNVINEDNSNTKKTETGKVIADGSSSIPSSLIFSAQTQFDKDKNKSTNNNYVSFNSKVINAKTRNFSIAYNTDATNLELGILGNNDTYEFVLDFPDLNDEKYYTNGTIKELYDEFKEANVALRINKTYLTENLDCIELPDYSFQALTMKNYDLVVKIFGKDEYNNDVKIANSNILILKSYTLKKAWIFYHNKFDKTNKVIRNYNITKVIIDFNYKDNIDYEHLNNYSNIQDYFNKLSIRSPYYDRYFYRNTTNGPLYLVNKQSQYFTQNIRNTINKNISYKEYNIDELTMRDTKDENTTVDSFKMKYVDSSGDVLNNYDALDYEIYYYEDKTSFGKRCVTQNDIEKNTETGFYEVFPVQKNVIHYIFKNASIDDILIDSMKSWMNYNKIYLYNSGFKNINNFTTDSGKYVEIYIPIKIGLYTETDTESINSADNVNLSVANDLYLNNYSRSKYDPSNIYGSYYNYSDSDTEECAIPYLEQDVFVKSILSNNEIYIKDYTTSNTKTLFDWRDLKDNSLDNYDFDILTYNENGTSNITTQKLNRTDVESIFTKFRHDNIVSNFDNVESQINSLGENFQYFIPSTLPSSGETTFSVSNTNSFLFIYFLSINTIENIKFVINESEGFEENNIELVYRLHFAVQNFRNGQNLFVIPCIKVGTSTNYTLSRENSGMFYVIR